MKKEAAAVADQSNDLSNPVFVKQIISQIGDGKIGSEISCLIQGRYKILYITTNEERRVIECLKYLAIKDSYRLYRWDLSSGMIDAESGAQVQSASNEVHSSPEGALDWLITQTKEDELRLTNNEVRQARAHIVMLFDIHHYLKDSPILERKLKQFATISSSYSAIIVAPNYQCPVGLSTEVTLLDFPLPSKEEIKRSLSFILKDLELKCKPAIQDAKEHGDEILSSVSGLTLTECENAFAKSLIKFRRFDIPTLIEEKRQIIKKNGSLEYREPKYSFTDIGGLDTLKDWLRLRKTAFSEDARNFGISIPKGIMLLGIPGTGKSMTADAVASFYGMPLLRLDVSSVFSSLVGDSEHNMRTALKIAEAVSPCCLWADEIEKAIGGVKSSNSTDSGVTARVFGMLLTWMQEKTLPVFVICTANNVYDIPPEFMRAGRFDEIFFVDLPSYDQRIEVTECLLLRKKQNPDNFALNEIAGYSQDYSPAEIEKAINNALFVAFSDNKRSLSTNDIISEIGKFPPLYSTRKEEIDKMRTWAIGENGKGGRAVLANKPCVKQQVKSISRHIDVGSL